MLRAKHFEETAPRNIVADGNLRLPKLLLKADSKIMCLTYINGKDTIAGGLSSGKIFFFSIPKGVIVRTLENPLLKNQHLAITGIQSFGSKNKISRDCPNNELIITSNVNGTVDLWNWQKKTCLSTIIETRSINTIALGKDNFATAGKNGCINMYDLNTLQLLSIFQKTDQKDVVSGHTSRVFSVQFHPYNENEFISGGWDDVMLYWDMRLEHPTRYIFGPHICGESMDFSADGLEVLTCSWRKFDSVQIWNYKTGMLTSSLTQDPISPKNYGGKWATKDIAVCGGTEPNAFRIVLPRKDIVLGGYNELPGGVYAIQCCGIKGPEVLQGSPSAKYRFPPEIEEAVISLPPITFCCGNCLYYVNNVTV